MTWFLGAYLRNSQQGAKKDNPISVDSQGNRGTDYKIEVQFNISYRQYLRLFFGVEHTDLRDANAPQKPQEMLG